MCIDLHKPSAESLREHVAIEDESKYVPSQFERGSPADITRTAIGMAYQQGFELAKMKFHQLLLAHDGLLWATIATQIEELKP